MTEFYANLTVTIAGLGTVSVVIFAFWRNLHAESKRNTRIEQTALESAKQVAENKGRIDVIEVLLQERLEDKNLIIELQQRIVELSTSKPIKKKKWFN